MKSCCQIALLVVLLGAANASEAQNYMGYFNTLPNGADLTCGGFLTELEDQTGRTIHAWFIRGYITAMNRTKVRTTPSDFAGLLEFVKQYCREHPLDEYAKGLYALDAELDSRAKQ